MGFLFCLKANTIYYFTAESNHYSLFKKGFVVIEYWGNESLEAMMDAVTNSRNSNANGGLKDGCIL